MERPATFPALARPLLQPILERLGPQECRRRLWHYFPGVLALLLTAVPHQEPVRMWVLVTGVVGGILIPAIIAMRMNFGFRRHPEEDTRSCILGFAIPLSILGLLLPAHTEVVLATASILSFGDGSATLFGLLRRGERLPWNRRKSWAGLVAFNVVGIVMTTIIYSIQATPAVPLVSVLACVGPAVLLCSLIETLPLPVSDNITVGFSAGLLMLLMQTLVVGWVA